MIKHKKQKLLNIHLLMKWKRFLVSWYSGVSSSWVGSRTGFQEGTWGLYLEVLKPSSPMLPKHFATLGLSFWNTMVDITLWSNECPNAKSLRKVLQQSLAAAYTSLQLGGETQGWKVRKGEGRLGYGPLVAGPHIRMGSPRTESTRAWVGAGLWGGGCQRHRGPSPTTSEQVIWTGGLRTQIIFSVRWHRGHLAFEWVH